MCTCVYDFCFLDIRHAAQSFEYNTDLEGLRKFPPELCRVPHLDCCVVVLRLRRTWVPNLGSGGADKGALLPQRTDHGWSIVASCFVGRGSRMLSLSCLVYHSLACSCHFISSSIPTGMPGYLRSPTIYRVSDREKTLPFILAVNRRFLGTPQTDFTPPPFLCFCFVGGGGSQAGIKGGASIVGESFGGMVAQRLALDFPDKVEG